MKKNNMGDNMGDMVRVCLEYVEVVGKIKNMVEEKWGILWKYNEIMGEVVDRISNDMWDYMEVKMGGKIDEKMVEEVRNRVMNMVRYKDDLNVCGWIFEEKEVRG